MNTANTANLGFVRTNADDYGFTSTYDSKATPTSFGPRSSSSNFRNTVTNQDFGRTTIGDVFDTRSDYDSKISTYLPKATATNFPTNTETVNTYLDTSTEFASKTSPTYVPKFPSTDYQNTISQEYVQSSLNTFAAPTEVNAPKISTSLAPPTPTRYFERTTFADTPTDNSPRISTAYIPKSTATTKISRGGSRYLPSSTDASTGYTGVQRSSTPRYRTEKLIPVPVDTGYSTVGYTGSSQEPSYFTREYLLESPVTKTYDGEFDKLLRIDDFQSPSKLFNFNNLDLKKTFEKNHLFFCKYFF